MSKSYEVLHFFLPPRNDGGGPAAHMGRCRTFNRALAKGVERLTLNMDPSPDDRIQIHRRGEHPTWLYRDSDGRICMWRKHPSERLELWGYTS